MAGRIFITEDAALLFPTVLKVSQVRLARRILTSYPARRITCLPPTREQPRDRLDNSTAPFPWAATSHDKRINVSTKFLAS
jgi:hypothetical protein